MASDTSGNWDWSSFWGIFNNAQPEPVTVNAAVKDIFNKDFMRWFSGLSAKTQIEVLEDAPQEIKQAMSAVLTPQAKKALGVK